MRTESGPSFLALISVDRSRPDPIHRQIYKAFRRAIVGGLLRAGQRVPSTRTLAIELGVSRLRVVTAYEQLLHEGYFVGRVGSGTFVQHVLPEDALHAPASMATQRLDNNGVRQGATWRSRPSRSRGTPPARDEGGLRPFRVSLPAIDRFPHLQWGRIVARHAQRLSAVHMAYGDPAGLGVLRTAIADHLRVARAVRCEPEQILVVSGSQAALRICATALLRPGDHVAVEEPGYPGAHAALSASGATLVPVPVDEQGISTTPLRAIAGAVRAVYVTPSHQYPLGMAMSTERRCDVLEWASRHDVWLFEDDYDSEYRYVSRPLAALQGMDKAGRVVYIGSFSKVMFPALRIGYIVVPRDVWDVFAAAREALDIFSPTLYQLALAEFLRDGHFARHLRRMRTLYLARREALLTGLERWCADALTVHNADAGLHVTTFLLDGRRDIEVSPLLSEHGLTTSPLSSCYLGDRKVDGLLLGFGGFSERALAGASRTLGDVLSSAGVTARR